MSVYSGKSKLSSILKPYSSAERERAKLAVINKVRFEMPKSKGVIEVVKAVNEDNNFQPLYDFVNYLNASELDDIEFFNIMNDARKFVHVLSPKFTILVECLLSLSWIKRTIEAVQAYTEFCIAVMVAQSSYIIFGIKKLMALWVPNDADASKWQNGTPNTQLHNELQTLHKLLERILDAIPMTFDVVLKEINNLFPYFKKESHVVAGFMHNVLWLIEYKPIFTDFALNLLLERLVILDVNAPRNEIEEEENEECDDEKDFMDDVDELIFNIDDCPKETEAETKPMNHPVAHTLDICMEKMFTFLDCQILNDLDMSEDNRIIRQTLATKFVKALLQAFDDVILSCHNSHHVQFLLFYLSSLKNAYAEAFLSSLWNKIKNPSVSAVIRQTAVGYLASFLSRSRFLSLLTVKHYLKELCNCAHQYIQSGDQYRSNGSLKANLVFFSICQAIFYVIAFRSRDLTFDKKSLLFLQSLQLSALVNCNLNPLRVCLPAVATAFAGVTRAYQLAYCHAILERNARRKLATVYANEVATPEETLDTFFPFDPYLLKTSGKRISPHYLQYQASDAEEYTITTQNTTENRRKRGDSEKIDDVDDFLFLDKRQKFADLAKSQEREAQFTYGLSPGFHL